MSQHALNFRLPIVAAYVRVSSASRFHALPLPRADFRNKKTARRNANGFPGENESSATAECLEVISSRKLAAYFSQREWTTSFSSLMNWSAP
jgi:hypothetical protein